MKRFLLFLSLFIISTLCYSQGTMTYGINAGTMPYGKISIKTKETGIVQKGKYGVTNPAVNLGLTFGSIGNSHIAEFTYAKNILLSSDSLADTYSNLYGGHVYLHTMMPAFKRIQLHVHLGGGISYYTEPKTALLDLGAKGRLMLFLSRHFALYGGGYYMHSILSKKYSAQNYGAEAGMAYYFDEMFTPKNTAKTMKFRRAKETLTVSVFNDWDTPVTGAKVTLVSGDNQVQKAPTVQGYTYVFNKLRPGPYTIKIEKNGFNTLTANLTVSNSKDKNAKSNNMYYNLESSQGTPTKNVFQAINDAVVERTDGNITYYVAKARKNTASTYEEFKFDTDLNQMMDNVHYKLVKKIDRKGFLFRNLTEEKIKKEKKNSSLKLPPLLDLKGACAFYTQNLKSNPALAEAYKTHITKALDNYLIWQKEIKWFCDGSPYEGDLLKGYDILSKMENKRDNYVYCITADHGYVVDGEITYTGGLSNRKMHGQGKLVKGTGWTKEGFVKENYYEGSFKNGKMNGTMYHKKVAKHYYALNGAFVNSDNEITLEERGTMVNDQWNGEVDFRASGFVGMYYTDHATKRYNNGVYWNQWIMDEGLSKALLGEKYRKQEEDQAMRRKIEALTENDIMNYVASMKTENYSGDTYYYVVFKSIYGTSSEMRGTVKHSQFGDWSWDTGHGTDGLFSDFRKVRPNTQTRALLELYWKLYEDIY